MFQWMKQAENVFQTFKWFQTTELSSTELSDIEKQHRQIPRKVPTVPAKSLWPPYLFT
jgi:hypothetical protein